MKTVIYVDPVTLRRALIDWLDANGYRQFDLDAAEFVGEPAGDIVVTVRDLPIVPT